MTKKLILKMKESNYLALRLCYGISRKGGKLPPGGIQVGGGQEYIKAVPGEWSLRRVPVKEPWDSSDEKAKEILSGEAIENFFERQAHLLAAANVDRLFRNAIEAWKFNLIQKNQTMDKSNTLVILTNVLRWLDYPC